MKAVKIIRRRYGKSREVQEIMIKPKGNSKNPLRTFGSP